MVTKSLAATFGEREKHPVGAYVQGQTLRGHLPSTTSTSLSVAYCHAPLDQWVSLTKSRVGRYRTRPYSGSKKTWNNRAAHTAHLLDPSRRAESCSSNSSSCNREGRRDRPSCLVILAFNKPAIYDSHMRAIGLDRQCLRCHKPQRYRSNRMTRPIRVPT